MKKVILLFAALFLGCSYNGGGKRGNQGFSLEKIIQDISIEVHKNDSNTIESYQATVKEYSYNERVAGSVQVQPDYRLSLKKIDGQLFSRIDFSAEHYGDGKARVVLSNGKEAVLMDRSTGEIEYRTPLEFDPVEEEFMNQNAVFGRLDITSVMNRFRTLAYDLQEEKESGIVCVGLPLENLKHRSNPSHTPVYSRLFLDLQNEVLLGSETQMTQEDGTSLTISNNYIYKEVDQEPILIGEMVSIHHDFPYTIDTSEYQLPIIEDEESVPEMTDREVEEILKNGGEVMQFEQPIGDPSDPDYTDVVVKVYEDIKVNTVEDELFRIVLN